MTQHIITVFTTISEPNHIFRALEICSDSFFNRSINRNDLAMKLSSYGHVIAAYVDNNLAGMVGYYANDYELKKAYLSIIVIRKEYQGYGIGSKLLQMFIEESKSKGMNVCRLEVGCYNEKAISFYLKKGFKKVGKASQTSYYYEYIINER